MFFKDKTNQKPPQQKQLLSLLPLRDIVVFPHMIVPLFVGRPKSIKAVEKATVNNNQIILASQKNAQVDNPKKEDIFCIGTIAEILQILKLPDGTIKVLAEGLNRCKIEEFVQDDPFFKVSAYNCEQEIEHSPQTEALIRNINKQFEKYAKSNPKVPPEMVRSAENIKEVGRLGDIIASHLPLKLKDKQAVLESLDPEQRLMKLYGFLNSEIEISELEKKIRGRVKGQIEKTQKEYYLQEQMKAIQKELGGIDNRKTENQELAEKISAAKMSKEAEEKSSRELKRLELMPPMSAEATVVRNYIDWLVSIPWAKKTRDKIDLERAEKILNADHYGLKQAKERVLEYLAVRRLVKKMKGPILCFVGPPGGGKTSLAHSIARATGRNFVRLSLGGVRDEAEIRGHRRTYIGALPGRIIQSMKKAKSRNPVLLLDEVDKMSTDFRGDPSAALLEVLDPEQNHSFSDHYLEVDYDLSEVLFITTANVIHKIPSPLQDRMEVIRLPGYTDLEKLKIAELFLIPKQLKAHGLTTKNLTFSEKGIKYIIYRYTREAGVRSLEREIASICRKVARQVVQKGKATRVNIGGQNIPKFLGPPKYPQKDKTEKNEIGIVNGLAWSEVGGDILPIEVITMDGKGKLTLTGQLGDVMQESAQAAFSYLRSKSKELALPSEFFQKIDIHVHIPEGAIPKDGPSAGITMATAMASAFTRKPVRNDIAMTGEITLRGRVLPIGGLKEKVLAAHRAQIRTVIIPQENEKDLKEIPPIVKKVTQFVLVNTMDQVLKTALVGYNN
ncbi:MAG: endopeptidase La [Deltaproteobacteria bacterium]|nr:endopeptidase La [Deltaproteobacteria bacterium]